MKNFLKKLISTLLVFTLFSSTFLPTFWFNDNKVNSNIEQNIKTELEKTHYIRWEVDTPYWKLYFISDKSKSSQYQSRTFWDLVDIAMAWASWAKLLWDPTWENFWVAIIDTAWLLPFIPSLSTVRNSAEAAQAIAKAYKTNKKVKDKINATKKVWPKVENRKKIWKFFYNDTAAKNLTDPKRKIDETILEEVIKKWVKTEDKKWQPWFFQYTKEAKIKNEAHPNWKIYVVKVVYNPKTNTVQHFHYEYIPKIPKR